MIALSNGKLLVAFDQSGPDAKGLPGKKGHDAKRNRWMQGLALSSGDGGETWQRVATYPFRGASLFRDGGDVYLLGEASGGLCLMRSPDGGGSWSAPMELTGDLGAWLAPTTPVACGEHWLVPCLLPSGGNWGVATLRAPRGASLMNRKAWAVGPVSAPLPQLASAAGGAGCGVPWAGSALGFRNPAAVSWGAGRHPWGSAGGAAILSTAGCGREHWCAALGAAADGSVGPLADGGGGAWLWLPLPGGHAKFDVFFDESGGRWWLAGSRGTPGLALGREACGEAAAKRIGLWWSDNLVDWQYAGEVAAGGEGPGGVRCDPSAAVSGNDLHVAYRAGGAGSRNGRETSRILCSRVEGFRQRGA